MNEILRRTKDILGATRLHSLEAAHIYESTFGDIEEAEWLAKTLVAIREVARMAYIERKRNPAFSSAPDDLNGFVRWVIKRAQALAPMSPHAARIFVLEQQAMGVYQLGRTAGERNNEFNA